ncbi:hypothetical protein [Staphylococcus saprophyticus]|uniref:hypothetical protein n=1 Tax=Staphylococcus saprophyticus TaxID=29385 RepID=UPI000658EFA8|nr:hypothetical protein [Staphylococcus saprophyticus]CRV22925.1 Uncharacterised protein [Streptococcus equi subsp. equi]MCT1652608.1 hypothetical protein [Staphylococcus saprophyticus]MDW3950109.1 hypothetical protein [Staphylococcus saprophyticus]MDW4145990.1 hypothetical protein [Staphylococcus saprophyticus]RXS16701.1 hypothetical protein EUA52_03740 [Staphylococcus saprophyticus]
MNNAIEKCIQNLVAMTNSSYQDVKKVTLIEFKRTPFVKTKHNYFVFIDNLKSSEINRMLNQFFLCKEG